MSIFGNLFKKEKSVSRIKECPATEEFEYGYWLFPNGTKRRIRESENDHMSEIYDIGLDKYFLE